jgi:hypothetical protein
MSSKNDVEDGVGIFGPSLERRLKKAAFSSRKDTLMIDGCCKSEPSLRIFFLALKNVYRPSNT